MTVGQFIRARREAAGVSLRSAAESMGVSATFLSEVETGRRVLAHVRWFALARAVPTIALHDLALAAIDAGPVRVDARHLTSAGKHTLAGAIVRAAEEQAKHEAA